MAYHGKSLAGRKECQESSNRGQVIDPELCKKAEVPDGGMRRDLVAGVQARQASDVSAPPGAKRRTSFPIYDDLHRRIEVGPLDAVDHQLRSFLRIKEITS